MSQQYPHNPNQPQQPSQPPTWGPAHTGQTYLGGPAPHMPPRPPKKGLNGWAIGGIVVGGLFVFLVVLGLIVGPQDTSTDGKTGSDKVAAAPTTKEPAKAAPSKPAPSKPAAKKETPAAKPKPKPKPAAPKPKEYANGDYVVGEDIPAGTYTTPGAEKGLFELCMVSTEPTSDSTFPQLKSANADERIIITLQKSDGVVSISGCEPLKPR